MMKPGTRLMCVRDVLNVFGNFLFRKGDSYDVLFVDAEDGDVTLNHIMYANEYHCLPRKFIDENFVVDDEF